MILANSLWRKVLATVVVAIGFVWRDEATILDSRFAVPAARGDEVGPPASPGAGCSSRRPRTARAARLRLA